MEKEASTVQVHCIVDSFTIKCHLFVAKAVAAGLLFGLVFFYNGQLLDQDHNGNSFVQSHDRVSVNEQSKSLQSIKGPVVFLSRKIYSETRSNIQLNLNFGSGDHQNKCKGEIPKPLLLQPPSSSQF